SRAPFRESAHALLMRALVAEGNPGEALLAYERLRVLLREELGTVPSVGMSALHVWALEQSDRAPSVGQPPTLYARKSDGVSIAYQVVGQGPPDIAIVSGFMSHLDSQWAEPAYASWISR